MPLQDSNPERRNLTVLSLCIILFYLAGGAFSDSSVRLQVVNVNFSKPEVLAYFTWCLLIWFCFRYWLVHQGSWKEGFCSEITSRNDCHFIYYNHLKKRFGLSNDYSMSYYKDRHQVRISPRGKYKVAFVHIFKDENGSELSKVLEISSFLDKCILLLCGIFLFFRRPSLSGYFVPYLMFFWAVFLGVYHAL